MKRHSLLPIFVLLASAVGAHAATLEVGDDAALVAGLDAAAPGDVIVLADGTYAGFTATRSPSTARPFAVVVPKSHP